MMMMMMKTMMMTMMIALTVTAPLYLRTPWRYINVVLLLLLKLAVGF